DREAAYVHARGMPDGGSERAGATGNAGIADTLDAKRVHVGIVLVDRDDLEWRHIGIHRDVVFAEIGVHGSARTAIHDRLLVQRERQAPDHPAVELALHHFRVDDATGRECADQTRRANLPEVRVDL